MSPRTLRARWVLPIAAPPIDGGYVAIADGRIVGVGGRNLCVGAVEDLGDVALAPGLVNAHCHLEFSNLGAPLGERGVPLPQWIGRVIAERKRADRDAAAAIAAGLAESLSAGVTTIAEIATAHAVAYRGAGPRPRLVLLHEAIGFSRARCDSVFAHVVDSLRESTAIFGENGLRGESTVALGESDLRNGPRGVSPHAPYTVHPELVSRLVGWAAEHDAPVAMHLAESPEELELLRDNAGPFRELLEARSMWDSSAIPPGTRVLDYLRRLAAAPRALVVHGNYLDQEEIEFLAEHRDRTSVVYCPRTHAYFGHSPYPLEAMVDAGVRVVLGTDSRASNPDLDLRRELAFVAEKYPSVSAATALRMGTLDAATALGLGGITGSLEPGKVADLRAVPCPAGIDPEDATVTATTSPRVWTGGVESSGAGGR